MTTTLVVGSHHSGPHGIHQGASWNNTLDLGLIQPVLSSRDNLLVTGSMERPRQVEVWRTGGDKLILEGSLRGEELASVASVLAIHPTRLKSSW